MNSNTASVILAKLFLEEVRDFEKDSKGVVKADNSYKLAIIDDAYNILKENDYYDIKNKMINYEGKKKSFYNLSSFLEVSPGDHREKDELITLGRFYLHPKLQESPKPPRKIYNREEGTFSLDKAEDFYLEIVESFTVRDLLAYYYIKHEQDPIPGTSHLTQMKNLTMSYDLDMVLFLIDSSAMKRNREDEGEFPASTPAFLPEHQKEAKELYIRRVNYMKEGGLNNIVPRDIY